MMKYVKHTHKIEDNSDEKPKMNKNDQNEKDEWRDVTKKKVQNYDKNHQSPNSPRSCDSMTYRDGLGPAKKSDDKTANSQTYDKNQPRTKTLHSNDNMAYRAGLGQAKQCGDKNEVFRVRSSDDKDDVQNILSIKNPSHSCRHQDHDQISGDTNITSPLRSVKAPIMIVSNSRNGKSMKYSSGGTKITSPLRSAKAPKVISEISPKRSQKCEYMNCDEYQSDIKSDEVNKVRGMMRERGGMRNGGNDNDNDNDYDNDRPTSLSQKQKRKFGEYVDNDNDAKENFSTPSKRVNK